MDNIDAIVQREMDMRAKGMTLDERLESSMQTVLNQINNNLDDIEKHGKIRMN